MTNPTKKVSNRSRIYCGPTANYASVRSALAMAGAEGLEPPTYGFGGVRGEREIKRLAHSEASIPAPRINDLAPEVSNQRKREVATK